MAYSRINILQRKIDIQNIYKKHSRHWEGSMTTTDIYNKIIAPRYCISRATFFAYLATNAKRQLTELEQD